MDPDEFQDAWVREPAAPPRPTQLADVQFPSPRVFVMTAVCCALAQVIGLWCYMRAGGMPGLAHFVGLAPLVVPFGHELAAWFGGAPRNRYERMTLLTPACTAVMTYGGVLLFSEIGQWRWNLIMVGVGFISFLFGNRPNEMYIRSARFRTRAAGARFLYLAYGLEAVLMSFALYGLLL